MISWGGIQGCHIKYDRRDEEKYKMKKKLYGILMLLVVVLCGCSKPRPSAKDYAQYSKAIQKGDLESVKKFRKTFGKYALENIELLGHYFNPLEMAIGLHKNKLVAFYLENGSEVNTISPQTGSPIIFFAIYRTNVDALKQMLHYKLNVNVVDKDGTSLLDVAASTGNAELLAAILPHVKDINSIDRLHLNALQSALINEGGIEVVKLLCENGININYRDDENNTALMFAIGNGKKEAAEYLIRHGADTTVANSDGSTAAKMAEEVGMNISGLNNKKL
jgi:ankyrin repeat protein